MDSPRSPRSPSLEQQEPAVKDEKHDEYLPPPIPENPPKGMSICGFRQWYSFI